MSNSIRAGGGQFRQLAHRHGALVADPDGSLCGLHNLEKRLLLVFDEASAIPDLIWEVTEGSLIDRGTEIVWVVFGNPTQTTGGSSTASTGCATAGSAGRWIRARPA